MTWPPHFICKCLEVCSHSGGRGKVRGSSFAPEAMILGIRRIYESSRLIQIAAKARMTAVKNMDLEIRPMYGRMLTPILHSHQKIPLVNTHTAPDVEHHTPRERRRQPSTNQKTLVSTLSHPISSHSTLSPNPPLLSKKGRIHQSKGPGKKKDDETR